MSCKLLFRNVTKFETKLVAPNWSFQNWIPREKI